MQSRNVNEIDNKHSSELYLSTKSVIDSFQISNHFSSKAISILHNTTSIDGSTKRFLS